MHEDSHCGQITYLSLEIDHDNGVGTVADEELVVGLRDRMQRRDRNVARHTERVNALARLQVPDFHRSVGTRRDAVVRVLRVLHVSDVGRMAAQLLQALSALHSVHS